MTLWLHLSYDEVQASIPYALVCETMEGAHWNTGRRRRLFNQTFNESERKRIWDLKTLAHRWYLTKGVPYEGVMMSKSTFELWQKLGGFCATMLGGE